MKIQDLFEEEKEVEIDWIKENCSDALNNMFNDKFMFRGMSVKAGAYLMKPQGSHRKSAYAELNYYTEVINNGMNGFQGFPKREIIMTTNDMYAISYGRLHVALPVNGAKIGVCPASDIWRAFQKVNKTYSSIDDFYRMIISLFKQHKIIDSYRDISTISELQQVLDRMKIDGLEITNNNDDSFISEINKTYSANAILKYITADGFRNASIPEFGNMELKSREIWTDAPTVMVAVPDGNYEKLKTLFS